MKLLSTRKTVLIVLVVALCSFALGAFGESKVQRTQADVYHDLEIFASILEKIQSYYVDDVDSHELMQKAIAGMLEDLDPHTQFLDGLDYEDLMVSTKGQFGGLGIYISFRDNYPTVIRPMDDTPGDRAGLRAGDRIVEIEGNATEGWRTDKAVGFLRGEPGSPVTFRVERPGRDDLMDFTIVREIINVKSVPYSGMFDDDTGYIKVNSFAKRTGDEIREALEGLEAQGMKGLVLDFRSNPGGLLQSATEISEMFLGKDKLLVYTKGRMPNSSRKYYSGNRKTHGGYPIVILINGHSASASEIFAGAMQDWDQALVVGQTSFGKGTVQTVFNLSETEAIKLTTAKYYTPSGRSIHKDRRRDTEEADDEEPLPEETNDGGVDSTPEMNDLETNDNAEVPAEDAEIYYTASGRIVYGGGGITPDLVMAPEYYTDLQRRLEANAFAFSFAVDAFGDREVSEEFETSDDVLDEFYAYIEGKEFEYTEEELTEENVDYIRTMIAREVVNNKYGRKAMYRVLLQSDKEFQKVLSMMKEAPTLQELFVYAEEQKAIKKASND